ncbi:MAG: hypothetical protein L0213_03860 [Candidatus Dadabacteria bacterium]|nr:hypothetical protein [Candidatus Dadabacteria bacterium]
MKAQKYENVEFVINHTADNMKVSLVWKKGGLYLSLSGLFLTDGETWYELPVKELENINVIEDIPLKLRFKVPSLDVVVTGKHAEKLLALRHFLLPYIEGGKGEGAMKSLLKLWAIGIRDSGIISKLMGMDPAEVEKLIKRARGEKLLYENGDMSPDANAMLSAEERKMLGLGE